MIFIYKIFYTLYYALILVTRKYNKDRKTNSYLSKKFLTWNNKRVYKYATKKNVKAEEVAIGKVKGDAKINPYELAR